MYYEGGVLRRYKQFGTYWLRRTAERENEFARRYALAVAAGLDHAYGRDDAWVALGEPTLRELFAGGFAHFVARRVGLCDRPATDQVRRRKIRKVAVDANLLVRNAARRLILGTAELTGYGVIVPETADLMSRQVYRKVRGSGALCEPDSQDVNVESRVWNLGRFGSGVVNGGARDTAGLVQRWTRMAKMRLDRGRHAEVAQDLARMRDVVTTRQVARTREAETRRLALEQGGEGSPNPMSPQERTR